MKGDDIAMRLLEFSCQVLRVVSALPADRSGKHIAGQLIRCGTSGGANYEEARAAESRADFAHKVAVAAKEVRESKYWLQLIETAGLVPEIDLRGLVGEGRELTAIPGASVRTARQSPSRRRPESGGNGS